MGNKAGRKRVNQNEVSVKKLYGNLQYFSSSLKKIVRGASRTHAMKEWGQTLGTKCLSGARSRRKKEEGGMKVK